MLSFALALAVAAVVRADNPLIPSGISSGCSTYLAKLDGDSAVTDCTKPIIAATTGFAPGSKSTPSSSDVSTALSAVCSASSSCSATTFRSELTNFYAACQNDLQSSTQVSALYDTLYSFIPLTEAVCAKDDSGAYCISSASANAKRDLEARAASSSASAKKTTESAKASTQIVAVNTTTFRSSNLAFLYLSADTPKTQLCSTCTKNILNSYVSFQASEPYAGVLSQSPLLGGESDLFSAVNSQCGSEFLSSSGTQAFGSLSGGNGLIGAASTIRPQIGGGLLVALSALFFGAWLL